MKTEKQLKNNKIQMNFEIKVEIKDEEDKRKKSSMMAKFYIFNGDIDYYVPNIKINQKYGFTFENKWVLEDFETATNDCIRMVKETINRYSYKSEKTISDMVFRELKEFAEKEKYQLFSYNDLVSISLIGAEAVFDGFYWDYVA